MMYCIRKAAAGETLLQINTVKLTRLTTTGDRKSKPWIHSFGKQLSPPCVGFSERHDNKVNRDRNRLCANDNYHNFVNFGVVLS